MTDWPHDRNNASYEADIAAERWVSRMLSNEMTDEERPALIDWLNVSAQNRVAFQKCIHVLDRADRAAQTLLEQEYDDELRRHVVGRRQSLPDWRAIAAAALVAIAVSVVLVALRPATTEYTYQTARGELMTVEFGEGSSAILNTQSQLSIKISNRHRTANLPNGEALFEVVRDERRPFLIDTPHGKITVVGTQFNIRTNSNNTSVGVVSGTVHVATRNGDTITLNAGERVVIGQSGLLVDVADFVPVTALSWRYGYLQYQDASLSEVVADLNRYFDQQILLSGADLGDQKFSARFELDDHDTIVEAISISLSLDVATDDNTVLLSPRTAAAGQ